VIPSTRFHGPYISDMPPEPRPIAETPKPSFRVYAFLCQCAAHAIGHEIAPIAPIDIAALRERYVVLCSKTRKQSPRIAMADRPMLVGRQAVIGVQLGCEGRADAGRCVGEVAAEQDAATTGESLETRQKGDAGSQPAGCPDPGRRPAGAKTSE
jgi:hypothetical protein